MVSLDTMIGIKKTKFHKNPLRNVGEVAKQRFIYGHYTYTDRQIYILIFENLPNYYNGILKCTRKMRESIFFFSNVFKIIQLYIYYDRTLTTSLWQVVGFGEIGRIRIFGNPNRHSVNELF